MFRKIFLATAAMAVATVPGWADDKERLGDFPIDSLSISVEDDDADLTVIYSRMEETATAAVLFGIVGSAINSGINADEDAGRADLFRHLEDELELASLVETSLTETLQNKDFSIVAEGEESHVLSVDIRQWGLIKVSFQDDRVRAYLRLRITMKDGRQTVWDVYENETGREAAFFDEYTPEKLKEELEALAINSGKRVAYEIIYR